MLKKAFNAFIIKIQIMFFIHCGMNNKNPVTDNGVQTED